MITLKYFPNKTFATKEEAFKSLVAHEKLIIAQKTSTIKHADSLAMGVSVITEEPREGASKADDAQSSSNSSLADVDTIRVKVAINACNYLDSHDDVSIDKSWNRTAKNTRNGLHLQEHKMSFDNLISDSAKFYVERKTWKELGVEAEGDTDVLMMESVISKEDNPRMFKKYSEKRVKNHSAGLRYVNISLAINSSDEDMKSYKAVWDKYYDKIVNKEDVDELGYFWAVTEQKIIEGSAVVRGSNPATPTISVESADSTSTTSDKQQKAPQPKSTPKRINLNFY